MSDEGKKSKAEKRLEAKKRKNRLILITIGVVVVALIVIGAVATLVVVMLSSLDDDDGPKGIVLTDTEVRIHLSEVNMDTVLFLTYEAKDGDVNYLVVQGTDGKIRTGFNSCDNETCREDYHYFIQEGPNLKCSRLGCTLPINLIGSDRTSCCMPFPLNHTVKQDNVVILRSDLEAGVKYFG